jgi:hypothetical protein
MRLISLATLCLLPTVASAFDFVTDPAMCDMEPMARNEAGMTFDGKSFWTIEYHCELTDALPLPDWTTYGATARVGYCEEPGFITPQIFAFHWTDFDPRQLRVVEGPQGEPVTYHLCEE